MDAPEKASGKTRYIHDIDLPGQLHGKILRSARVHARISRIDTSAAKALPGVHVVITAADVPDQRPIGVAKDHFPLKTDRVRSQRDEIAAVAAESRGDRRSGAEADRGRVRGPAGRHRPERRRSSRARR